MSAHADIRAETSHPLEAICQALAQGDHSLLPEGDYTDVGDELECAADAGDYNQVSLLIAHGIAKPAYDSAAYIGQNNWGEFTPFDEWFDEPYWLTRAESMVAPIGGAA